MNIKEAKDVLARVKGEYQVYCGLTDANETWGALDKTVDELAGAIANADAIKTFVLQRGAKCYEPVYAQVFDEKKIALLVCRGVTIDNVNRFYIVPVAKTLPVKDALGEEIVMLSTRGGKRMGGM